MAGGMKHQPGTFHAPGLTDAAAEIARLRQVLALARDIAGETGDGADDRLEAAARISSLYAAALPIVQRRFDDEAATVARWSAAGLEALLLLDETGRPVQAPASRLALELDRALARLARILSP
jgi:hypothetical protein